MSTKIETGVNHWVETFQCLVDKRGIDNARAADELVCDLLGDSGLVADAEAYNTLSSALCEAAGREFPGAWEDYPVAAK